MLWLCACATTTTQQTDPAVAELDNQAQHVRRTMDQLAATWQSSAAKPEIYPIPTSGALAKPISMVWYGSLEKAVRSVAVLSGYGFQIEGRPPASTILVGVNAHQEPAFEVLQDIGLQAGTHAGVVVRPSQHLIAVVYVGTE